MVLLHISILCNVGCQDCSSSSGKVWETCDSIIVSIFTVLIHSRNWIIHNEEKRNNCKERQLFHLEIKSPRILFYMIKSPQIGHFTKTVHFRKSFPKPIISQNELATNRLLYKKNPTILIHKNTRFKNNTLKLLPLARSSKWYHLMVINLKTVHPLRFWSILLIICRFRTCNDVHFSKCRLYIIYYCTWLTFALSLCH